MFDTGAVGVWWLLHDRKGWRHSQGASDLEGTALKAKDLRKRAGTMLVQALWLELHLVGSRRQILHELRRFLN